MECKNTDCKNETTGKRIYCSLTCRNIFVNTNLRSYDKVLETFQKKRKEKEDKYLENPKRCLHCDIIIPYISKKNKYCNSSCFAKATNGNREYTWGNKISQSIHKYLINNGIKGEGKIGIYDITCNGCGNIFQKERPDLKYCSSECMKNFKRKDMDEYQKYRLDTNFKFGLSDYPNEFDFSLIKEHGWYSPSNKNNNLTGVSRDHILSVREGFEMGIDPQIISHPANCRLMIHNENISKNKRSDITIEELLEKITIFESKYPSLIYNQ